MNERGERPGPSENSNPFASCFEGPADAAFEDEACIVSEGGLPNHKAATGRPDFPVRSEREGYGRQEDSIETRVSASARIDSWASRPAWGMLVAGRRCRIAKLLRSFEELPTMLVTVVAKTPIRQTPSAR